MKMLSRTTFATSREMDFFSEKELVTQTGHEVGEWPLVFVKELLDNSLDACEEADIAPVLTVAADPSGIGISDNGPGLPEETLKGALDFTVRVSNREAYVAPDRGAQGNALKTILAMPVVVDKDHGKLIVQTHGKRHVITCRADPVSQRAVIHDDVTNTRTSGTQVRIEWAPSTGNVRWPFGNLYPCSDIGSFSVRFRELVHGFAVFNPHATIKLDWFGDKTTWEATKPAWEKWKPCRPTSVHWYAVTHLRRLVGAYITHDKDTGKDQLVSDFVAEFDGFSGSQKRAKLLAEANLKRVMLSEFVVDGRLDEKRIELLLRAMQQHSRPVKSQTLGIIGKDHLRARLLEMGVLPESFRYKRKLAKCKNSPSANGEKPCFLPSVLESAFGYLGEDSDHQRRIFSGANWSAAIKNPFRSFGSTGEGLETALADMRVTRSEPVVFVLHLAHPRVEYTDRGKSALVVSEGRVAS